MQKQNMNWFSTVLIVVICFIILTDLTKFLLKFCVDEVFEERGVTNVRRIKRGKSSSLGMPKALQVKLPLNEDERGDAFRGIPKLRRLSLLQYLLGVPWESPSLSSCLSSFSSYRDILD